MYQHVTCLGRPFSSWIFGRIIVGEEWGSSQFLQWGDITSNWSEIRSRTGGDIWTSAVDSWDTPSSHLSPPVQHLLLSSVKWHYGKMAVWHLHVTERKIAINNGQLGLDWHFSFPRSVSSQSCPVSPVKEVAGDDGATPDLRSHPHPHLSQQSVCQCVWRNDWQDPRKVAWSGIRVSKGQ